MKDFSFDTLPPHLSGLVIAKVPLRSSLELMKVNKKLRGHQLHYGPFKNRKVRTIRLCGPEDGAHFSFYEGASRKWIGKQYQSIFIDEFPVNDLGLVRPQETPSPTYLRWPPNQLPAYPYSLNFSYQPWPYQSCDLSWTNFLSQSYGPYGPFGPFGPYTPYDTTTSVSGSYCHQPYYDLSEVYERHLQHLLRPIKSCVRLVFGHYTTHSCPLKLDVVKEICFDKENLKGALDLMQPIVTNRLHLQLAPNILDPLSECIKPMLGSLIKGCKELSIWNSDKVPRQMLDLVADPKSIWLWFRSINIFKHAITDGILQYEGAALMLSLEHSNLNEGLAEIRKWLSAHRELKESSKRREILESFATHTWMDREWLSRKWDWMESQTLMKLMDLLSLKEKLGQSPKKEEVLVFEKAGRKFAIIVWASRERIYCVRFFSSFWL